MERSTTWRIGALVFTGILVIAALTVVPFGAVAQEGGVTTPTPSGTEDPYDCSDFDTREQVEAVFNPDNDVSGLDRDGDDVACESIGTPQENTQTETPTQEPTDTPEEDTQTETEQTDHKQDQMKEDKQQTKDNKQDQQEEQKDQMNEDKQDKKDTQDKQMGEDKQQNQNEETKDEAEQQPPC